MSSTQSSSPSHTPKARPLSPHLQVYRPQLTSMLSIFHRATGVFLAFGSVALVWWLSALAAGPDAYAQFQLVLAHPLSKLMLLAWCFSLSYHLCNGIRHLFWDVGAALEIEQVYRSGVIMLVSAFSLTAVIVYFAVQKTGGLL